MSDLIERAKEAQDAVLSSVGGTFGAQRQSASDARYALEDLMRALIDTTAERDALRALLAEAREELAAYVDADYPYSTREQYPDMQRRYLRDMDLCWRIDAALQEDTPNE